MKTNNIVFCGYNHTFVHCKDGLYSFGSNNYGQLGIGNNEDKSTPQKTTFNSDEVISVSCGGYHTIVHCKDGLYSFGCNYYGQLGIGNNIDQLTPQKTTFNSKEVISVSCGYSHTIVHCKDGLYSFGWNSFGQLGIGNNEDQSTPQKTTFNSNEVISVSCGGEHTFVLCKDGLYSFGWNNKFGQLGIGNKEHQSIPQKTTFNPDEVISVSCGYSHTIVHCKDGLYSFGWNKFGQLGIGNNEEQSTPQKTTFNSNEVISVSCGGEHTFVLCKDGLYSFGRNDSGQLGIGNIFNQFSSQKTKFNSDDVISVSCGGYHTIVHCKDGLYSFGCNDSGQLGIKGGLSFIIPQRFSLIPYLTIKDSKISETSQKIQKAISNQSKEINDFTKYLFETKKNSDMTIKNHQVHKAWIQFKSPQLLDSENQKILISMSDIAFNSMMKWIYTDELDCEPTIIPKILKYSLQTEMNDLKQKCLETISFAINKNQYTAFDILIETQKLSLKTISNKLIWFIGSNKLKIPKTFFDLNPPYPLVMKIIELSSLSIPQIELFPLFFESKNDNLKVFSNLLNNKESADYEIEVNKSVTFFFHKFILAPKWKYFEDILIQEKKQITIDLPISTFEKVIEFFYVGLKTISIHDACWILQNAEEYQLTTHVNLIELCKYSTESIRLNDWKETLTLSIKMQHKQLGMNVSQQALKETTPDELFQYFFEKNFDQQQQINQQNQQIKQLHQQINQQFNHLQQQIDQLQALLQKPKLPTLF